MGLDSTDRDTVRRAAVLDAIIPRPPADIAPLRAVFSRMVSRQWEAYAPEGGPDLSAARFAKGRFIAEMYARACYAMLLVSANGPLLLRVPVRAAAFLPQSRALAIQVGRVFLARMDRLLPAAVNRQLVLMSGLMGMLLVDLYRDYLHTAMDAMRSGVAA